MSDEYEGLTAAQYEDFEPEYDVEVDEDTEEESGGSLLGPMSGHDLYTLSKYAPANVQQIQAITDEDTGYGANSYFAHAMITE